MSEIPSPTLTAYLETDYRVFSEPPFALCIGAASETLLKLYCQYGADCATFVTACNPYSQQVEAAANAARQAELESELKQRGLKFIAGEGRHPAGGWPAEASFLVLGISREEAMDLGRRYEQNAVVWCGADAVPELVLLR